MTTTEIDKALSRTVIQLMKGVVYRDTQETTWESLPRLIGALRDHFAVLGVEVVVDDVEGYAYLRSKTDDEDPDPLPRLVQRRTLSYPVSLLLLLLRRAMVEFEATSGEPRLVLTRQQLVDLLVAFLPTTTNEARLVDQVDRTIGKVTELGFLRQLRGQDAWEVRRILKAYVDAQTLSDFDARLTSLRSSLGDGEKGDG